MAKKWKYATVHCFGIASYSIGNFSIRRNFTKEEDDKDIVDSLRGIKGLNIVDYYEETDEELEDLIETEKRPKGRPKLRPNK